MLYNLTLVSAKVQPSKIIPKDGSASGRNIIGINEKYISKCTSGIIKYNTLYYMYYSKIQKRLSIHILF